MINAYVVGIALAALGVWAVWPLNPSWQRRVLGGACLIAGLAAPYLMGTIR